MRLKKTKSTDHLERSKSGKDSGHALELGKRSMSRSSRPRDDEAWLGSA